MTLLGNIPLLPAWRLIGRLQCNDGPKLLKKFYSAKFSSEKAFILVYLFCFNPRPINRNCWFYLLRTLEDDNFIVKLSSSMTNVGWVEGTKFYLQ